MIKQKLDIHEYICVSSWDVNLPVLLDYEIWKSSNMIFQPIPNTEQAANNDNTWNDGWHEITYKSTTNVSQETNHEPKHKPLYQNL